MSSDAKRLRRLVNEELIKLFEYRPNTFMLSRMEEQDQDGDGDEDFDDVRVARYVAGGMPKDAALNKVKLKPMGKKGGKGHKDEIAAQAGSLSESIRRMTLRERRTLHEAVRRRLLKEQGSGAESGETEAIRAWKDRIINTNIGPGKTLEVWRETLASDGISTLATVHWSKDEQTWILIIKENVDISGNPNPKNYFAWNLYRDESGDFGLAGTSKNPVFQRLKQFGAAKRNEYMDTLKRKYPVAFEVFNFYVAQGNFGNVKSRWEDVKAESKEVDDTSSSKTSRVTGSSTSSTSDIPAIAADIVGSKDAISAADGAQILVKGTNRLVYEKREGKWYVAFKIQIAQVLSFVKEEKRKSIAASITSKVNPGQEFTIPAASVAEDKRDMMNDPSGFKFRKTSDGYEDPVAVDNATINEKINDTAKFVFKDFAGKADPEAVAAVTSTTMKRIGENVVIETITGSNSVFVRIKNDPNFSGFYELFKPRFVRNKTGSDVVTGDLGTIEVPGNGKVLNKFKPLFDILNPNDDGFKFKLGFSLPSGAGNTDISNFNTRNRNYYVCSFPASNPTSTLDQIKALPI